MQKSRAKPHVCDIKATSMRVDRQPIATPKPPQCDLNATSIRPQSYLKAGYSEAGLKIVNCLLPFFGPRIYKSRDGIH
jgi:hypothetical protein